MYFWNYMDMKSKNIGLVLSGGGSKGLAHAGVLQFFESDSHKHQ